MLLHPKKRYINSRECWNSSYTKAIDALLEKLNGKNIEDSSKLGVVGGGAAPIASTTTAEVKEKEVVELVGGFDDLFD